MSIPASKQINSQIQMLPLGILFSRSDFYKLNLSEERIDTELSRLYRQNKIQRKRRGLYYLSKETPLGPSVVSPEQLAKKMLTECRRYDKRKYGSENKRINRLIPVGLTLFNILGLSTQVPAQKEYYSSFSLKTQTLDIKKMPMELWDSATDFELMIFFAIAFRNKVSGENPDTIDPKIYKILIDKKINSEKLLSLARKIRGNVGQKVMFFIEQKKE